MVSVSRASKILSGTCMCMVYDRVDEYMVPGTMGALKKGKKKWLGRGEGQKHLGGFQQKKKFKKVPLSGGGPN